MKYMRKRKYLQTANQVNLSASELWVLISKGYDMELWHPIINSSRIEGNERFCNTDKGVLRETIWVNDSATKTYKYFIHPQKIYPISTGIISTIKICEGSNFTWFLWDIEFEESSASLTREMKEGFQILSQSAANTIDQL